MVLISLHFLTYTQTLLFQKICMLWQSKLKLYSLMQYFYIALPTSPKCHKKSKQLLLHTKPTFYLSPLMYIINQRHYFVCFYLILYYLSLLFIFNIMLAYTTITFKGVLFLEILWLV